MLYLNDRASIDETIRVRPKGYFVIGIDPGAVNDPTAIAAIEWRRFGTGQFVKNTGVHGWTILKEKKAETFDLRYLKRLALGLTYPVLADQVVKMLRQLSFSNPESKAHVLVDATGVGRAFCDILSEQGVRNLVRVTITSGNVPVRSGENWAVPKLDFVSTLSGRIQVGDLRFPKTSSSELEALRNELGSFKRTSTSAAGKPTFGAREGAHDADKCDELAPSHVINP
jgi:hypothetical protein